MTGFKLTNIIRHVNSYIFHRFLGKLIGMVKDFSKWHKVKSVIESDKQPSPFREREIWWCSIGLNIGVEADGKHDTFERPILIIRKFNKDMLWGIPLTTRSKDTKYHLKFTFHERESTAILSQLKILSGKRLVRKIGKLGRKKFDQIRKQTVELAVNRKADTKTAPFREPRVPSGNM